MGGGDDESVMGEGDGRERKMGGGRLGREGGARTGRKRRVGQGGKGDCGRKGKGGGRVSGVRRDGMETWRHWPPHDWYAQVCLLTDGRPFQRLSPHSLSHRKCILFFVDVICSPVVRRRPLVSYVLNSYCSRSIVLTLAHQERHDGTNA